MKRLFHLACCLWVIMLLMVSCKGKDEGIPAYIQIDSVAVSASGIQGNAVHQISAVQLFVDGTMLGVFELPCKVPALVGTGKHEVSLLAMTFINGSRNQRAVYKPLLNLDTSLQLETGKVTRWKKPLFSFRPATNFLWTEDFEDGNSSFKTVHADKGDTVIIANVPFNLGSQFTGFTKALQVNMKGADTTKYLDLISFNSYSGIPTTSDNIILEFDLKSDLDVQIALGRSDGSTETYVPFLYCYADPGNWKRYYLNLVPEIAGQPATNKYRIYFTLQKSYLFKSDATVYLDNIRFCYLP